jgi:hypothetical protein
VSTKHSFDLLFETIELRLIKVAFAWTGYSLYVLPLACTSPERGLNLFCYFAEKGAKFRKILRNCRCFENLARALRALHVHNNKRARPLSRVCDI